MASPLRRLIVALKAAQQLGPVQTGWFALYQLGLHSGLWQWLTPVGKNQKQMTEVCAPFLLPERETLVSIVGDSQPAVIAEADEIVNGFVRLFGGPPVALELVPQSPLKHWTQAEQRRSAQGVEDLKYVWEPARFGWAYTLGRAYLLTGSPAYPSAFWRYLQAFLNGNPPNQGLNWASGQEVALRLVALLFAAKVFANAEESTPERMAQLTGSLAAHATRIPATLSYAHAQHNNHLLSEALGLFAAGAALPGYKHSARWRKLGKKILEQALLEQIDPDGVYAQHSMNYHRLMLQVALLAQMNGLSFSTIARERLAAAATWLLAQLDPSSGRVPNYGSNDGALILPLRSGSFGDYRPVAQAAARAFLGQAALPPGAWDELSLWLGLPMDAIPTLAPLPDNPAVHRLGNSTSWGVIRANHYQSRPAHADQLHIDLWWHGRNVAVDAGTYRYSAAPPWNNSLAETVVHNTILVNGQNQMERAGRFLWLDWAQAEMLDTGKQMDHLLAAEQDGYRRIGVLQRRVLQRLTDDHWQVDDHLLPLSKRNRSDGLSLVYHIRLHWLLPDWRWELKEGTLSLFPSEAERVQLTLTQREPRTLNAENSVIGLVRAGKALVGPEVPSPVMGWFSPTYGEKRPALSFFLEARSRLPLALLSEWRFEG